MRKEIGILGGFLVGVGLMVFDEILTLAIYCQRCGYAIPLLGTWNLYDAEGFAWVLILIGSLICILQYSGGHGKT
jgi:hypothetical protein